MKLKREKNQGLGGTDRIELQRGAPCLEFRGSEALQISGTDDDRVKHGDETTFSK